MKKLNNFKNLSKAIRDFNRKAPVVIKRITSDNILTTNCDVKLFNFNKCNILIIQTTGLSRHGSRHHLIYLTWEILGAFCGSLFDLLLFMKACMLRTCPILLIVFYCMNSFYGLLAVTPLHIFLYMIILIELCRRVPFDFQAVACWYCV